MKTFDIKNLYLGTVKNEAVVTLDLKQSEENGVYTLDAVYNYCAIETEKIYNLESEVETFVENAMSGYSTDTAPTVLSWLNEWDCRPSDLVGKIVNYCEGNENETDKIFNEMGIYRDCEDYEEEAISTVEHNGKKFHLIVDEDMYLDSSYVWDVDLAYRIFVRLFALIEVYNGKFYTESVAEEIKQAMENCQVDLNEAFEAFIKHTY